VSVLGHAGYAVLDSPAGAQTLGIAGAEHPNLIIAVVPMPAKGTNEQEFQRRQFQVLNAKLLLEVEELREAVILAGALQRRSERFGEAVAGAGASPIAPGARAEDLVSRRELQVLGMIAEGAPNSEIADRLVIAETTVQSHVQHILRKLGVRNRTEAATRYLRG
jgi:ATP/maltotriose-dependent transcriptional regulator MalT